MGLDAHLRGHDVFLVLDLRNRHLVTLRSEQLLTTIACQAIASLCLGYEGAPLAWVLIAVYMAVSSIHL